MASVTVMTVVLVILNLMFLGFTTFNQMVGQWGRGLEMIKRIAAQGIGVIVITHIMAQAFQVADRIVVIRQGRVAGDVKRTATSPDEIVQMITGEAIESQAQQA